MPSRTLASLALAVLLVGAAAGSGLTAALSGIDPPERSAIADPSGDEGLAALETFDSPAAFRAYVDRGQRFAGGDLAGGAGGAAVETTAVRLDRTRAVPQAATADGGGGDAEPPSRIGTTNVQVAGLDEPDRVKVRGSTFFYAPSSGSFVRETAVGRPTADSEPDATGSDLVRPEPGPRTTHVVDASSPASPSRVAGINATGQLLRSGDRLVVLGDSSITGYDVSDPANPDEVWSRPLNDAIVTARERNGTVYLVTRTPAHDAPCPIQPVGGAEVSCTDVHHPRSQIAADVTYTALAIDAGSGAVGGSVGFVGTGRGSVVYMAEDALYVTYTKRTPRSKLMADFLVEEFDRTPATVTDRIRELRSYDLSPESVRREIAEAVRSWLGSLDDDERRRIRSALEEQFSRYLGDRQRDLARTGIVRIGVGGDELSIGTTATVPGTPLNQFALDRRDGRLRIATTVPGAGDAESVADLTVLDAASLDTLGNVTGMGEGQRIYAVRYVDDTAYLVTFRRVDPLHVVDLSEPRDPTEVGTLKLPGFSNYLHPIDDGHLLGIGEEDGRVKAVLFDVSDPENPTVADDLLVDASWSAVSRTHHAFAIDRKHGVVFLPAGGAGQVVDYTNGSLEREHVVRTAGQAERARYVGNYLYVFAAEELAVLDETDWSRAATVDLPG